MPAIPQSNTQQQTPQASPQDTTTLMATLNALVGGTIAEASAETPATVAAAEAAHQAAFAGVLAPVTADTSTGGSGGSADSSLESPITLEQTKASRAGANSALTQLQGAVRDIEAATAASRAKQLETVKAVDEHTKAKVTDIESTAQLDTKTLKQDAEVDARTAAEIKALQTAHAKSQLAVSRLQEAIMERKMFTLGLDKEGNPLRGAKKAQHVLTGLFGFDQMNALSAQTNQDLVTAMAYTTQLEQEINTKFSQANLEKTLLTADEAKAKQATIINGAEVLKQFTNLQGKSAQVELLNGVVGMHKEDANALSSIFNANKDLYTTDVNSWQALYQFHQARSLAREIKNRDELRAAIHDVSVRDKANGGPGMSTAAEIVITNALWGVDSYEKYMAADPTNAQGNISKILNGLYFATKVAKQDSATQYLLALNAPGEPASQEVLRTYENYLAQPDVQNSMQIEVARAGGAVVKDPKTGQESIDQRALQEFLGTQAGQVTLERARVNALRGIDVRAANESNFYQSGGMVVSKQDLSGSFPKEKVDLYYQYVPPAWITGTATSAPETKKAVDTFIQNVRDGETAGRHTSADSKSLLTWVADGMRKRNELFAKQKLKMLNGNTQDPNRFDLPIQLKGPGGLLHSVNLTRPEDLLFMYNQSKASLTSRVWSAAEPRNTQPTAPFNFTQFE